MRFFMSFFIVLFSFSYIFAAPHSDVENKRGYSRPSAMTFGLYGLGYIPMDKDKDLIGYGGGAGFKTTYNIGKYFGVGLSTGLTIATSKHNNVQNLTLLSDTRLSFIIQRETSRGENGFVPWGSFGFGLLAASGDYGGYKQFEDGIGFNFVFSAGLRYNFRNAYIGVGAEYFIANVYGDLVDDYYNGYYYYPRRTSAIMNPSGFNIFGEFGFRL